MVTSWTLLNPAGHSITEFRQLTGALNYRRRSQTQTQRKTDSVAAVGLVPTIIPVVYTNIIEGTPDLYFYLLDKVDLWEEEVAAGRDPLKRFDIYVMPPEEVSLDHIAQVVVKLNRVQKKMTDEELILFAAPFNHEYDTLAQLMQIYTHVGISEIRNCLRPNSTNQQNRDDFENLAFVATNVARGTETIEFLDKVHEFLSNDNRHNLIKRNQDFIFELAQRMIAHPHIHFSYAAGIGRGTTTGTIPGNGLGSTTATSRGTIQFRNVANNVLRSDVDFPKRAFPTGNRLQRRAWNNRILDAIGIM